MKVIGITGLTGSGKTTVLGVLKEHGAVVLDCDRLWYELLEQYDFIRDELPRQKALCEAMPKDRNRDMTALNQCFVRMIGLSQILKAE